jgi:hypothetical protein
MEDSKQSYGGWNVSISAEENEYIIQSDCLYTWVQGVMY